MIKINDVTKTFGAFTAVDRLSLEIKDGEIFGFLGPNGAGKSTTLKMITGILPPTSGDIEVSGYSITKDLFFTILGMIFGVEMYWFSFKEMVFGWYGNDPSFILAAILSSLFLLTLFIPLPVNCALSQEGETFHLNKTLPIKPWHYVMVKLIPTFTMQLIVGLCALIIGILFHPWFPIAVFLTYMLLSLALDFIALLFDSCFVVFDWQSENEYVRRPNSIFSIMGVGGGFIFILIQLFIVSLKVGENFPNVLHGTMALMAGLWVGFSLIAFWYRLSYLDSSSLET